MGEITVFDGSSHVDERGKLNFFNTFDMKEVVRLYEIEPSTTNIIRAWQGHQEEKKWFYCPTGGFVINLIKIDDFQNPSKKLKVERFILSEDQPSILEVPGGFANGFKSITEGAKLMVFSNFSVAASQKDDFRFPVDQWSAQW